MNDKVQGNWCSGDLVDSVVLFDYSDFETEVFTSCQREKQTHWNIKMVNFN